MAFFDKFRCSQDVSHLSDFHFPHIRLIWRSSRLLRKVEVGNITSTEIVLVAPNPMLTFQHFLRQTNKKVQKSCETTLRWPDWYSARRSLNRSQYIDSATVPLFLAPPGALIAIPTFYWSTHHPLFQITPVLDSGLSLSEPLQLYKGYNAI